MNPNQPNLPPVSPPENPKPVAVVTETPQTAQVFGVQQTKPKSKLPIIAGVVVLVLVAAGIGAFMLLSNKKDPAPATSTPASTSTNTTTTTDSSISPEQIESEAKDNTRQIDASRLVASITEYMANNNGKVPTIAQVSSEIVGGYIKGDFHDPATAKAYTIVATAPAAGEMQYASASKCGPDEEITSGTKRQIAIRIKLESGKYSCIGD